MIEIDGLTHSTKKAYDCKRDTRLKEIGLPVIRLEGYYVLKNISGVLDVIMDTINCLRRKTTP